MSESPTMMEKAEGATQVEYAEKRDVEQSSEEPEDDRVRNENRQSIEEPSKGLPKYR
jgi:hypothetical protein